MAGGYSEWRMDFRLPKEEEERNEKWMKVEGFGQLFWRSGPESCTLACQMTALTRSFGGRIEGRRTERSIRTAQGSLHFRRPYC